MGMKIFSVFDCKAAAFHRPMFFENNAVALRSFKQAAMDENSVFHKHAADFTLFEIGEWFELEGKTTQLEAKVNLGTALQVRGDEERPEASGLETPVRAIKGGE